jgi:hypothetical protein
VIYLFQEVIADASLAKRFIRALETMPEAMAQYKGIAAARERLINLAKAGTSILRD